MERKKSQIRKYKKQRKEAAGKYEQPLCGEEAPRQKRTAWYARGEPLHSAWQLATRTAERATSRASARCTIINMKYLCCAAACIKSISLYQRREISG